MSDKTLITISEQYAYDFYIKVKEAFDNGQVDCIQKARLRRQLEMNVIESGIRGKCTNEISNNALISQIRKIKGLSVDSEERISKEHPITPRIIADFMLSKDYILLIREFFFIWKNDYVTTTTTSKENQLLKKFQKDFEYGDDWRQMYKQAGIVLVKRPRLSKRNLDQIIEQYKLVI